MNNIELSSFSHAKVTNDLEKSPSESDEVFIKQGRGGVKRKLGISLIIETVLSIASYYYYEDVQELNAFLAPAFLGASTAALAQSMNQAQKKKYSLNRVFKFTVWGVINGTLTALWIDLLMKTVTSLSYRILLDQIVGTPFFQLTFNILNSLWDHGEIHRSMRQTFLKSLRYSYYFWPFFSIGSFLLLPGNVIFPANCLANLIWNIVLSKIA